MNAGKLSSDEVPQKFIEWLLTMGYPPEKVPAVDIVAQKCQGQYYMVWRSLMEHVQSKHEIREKRLNVFCDDVRLCQQKDVFNKREPNVVIPEQLLLWRQQQDFQKKVVNAEQQVTQAKEDLKLLMDKVSTRICQRDISRKKLEDKQRRVWLLRQVAAELALRKKNLEDTRNIATSLCASNDDDLQNKVDKCLALLRKPGPQSASMSLLASNPAASSSVVSSQGDDIEEHLSTLARCRGDALWTQLCERRAALHATLAHANTLHSTTPAPKEHSRFETVLYDKRGRTMRRYFAHLVRPSFAKLFYLCDYQLAKVMSFQTSYCAMSFKMDESTTQSVLAHTASLHCTLTLEVMKNRIHLKQTRARFAAQLEDLNDHISGVACELLVLRCERASAEARVRSLRTLLDELATNSGVFEIAGERSEPVNGKQISAVDKTIETSRDELKRLILSLATTERKILSTKEVLTAVFNSFQSDVPIDKYKGIQLNFPQESIATICQFYQQEHEKRRSKADLSLDFDTSDCSFDNNTDLSNPRFIDELRVYLKKFELEKNRKLVMESGEKIWIFETLQTSLERLHSNLLSNDVTPLLCPSMRLSRNIQNIITDKQTKEKLDNVAKEMGCDRKLTFNLDITARIVQEESAIDLTKKQIGENLQSLQKSAKLLELGQKNLQLWQDDVIKNCVSNNRTVDGKSYKEYEACYIDGLSLIA